MSFEKVFIFPLSRVVFWPVLKKPLNIFEPRYIQMVNDSIEQRIPICLCYGVGEELEDTLTISHDSIKAIRKVAGAGLPNVLQRVMGSEEMLIALEPVAKYRIHSILPSQEPYIVAEAKRVIEFETVLPENMLLLNKLEASLRSWSKRYFKDQQQYQDLIKEFKDPLILIATFCEFVVDNPALKQSLLELDDVNEKLILLSEYYIS